jgi:hypothetical protein
MNRITSQVKATGVRMAPAMSSGRARYVWWVVIKRKQPSRAERMPMRRRK